MRRARAWLIAGVISLVAVPTADAASSLRLDGRFGDDGIARVRFKLRPSAWDLTPLRPVRQPDGKVLVAAAAHLDHGNSQILLARFTRRGRPDRSFGHRGWTHLGLRWNFDPGAVQLQPDGRILVLGGAGNGRGLYPSPAQFGVARLLPDGSPDRSFGSKGFVAWNPSWRPGTLFITALPAVLVQQADGRLLAAGMVEELRQPGDPSARVVVRRAALVRFNPDGSVDESFGHGGGSEGPDRPDTWFWAWAALPDDQLATLESRQEGPGPPTLESRAWWLHRFTAAGAPDPAFGQNGSVRLGLNVLDGANELLPARNGSLLVLGSVDIDSPAEPTAAVRRITPEGQLDASYGTGCRRSASHAYFRGGAATSDGGILVTATRFVSHSPALLARYDARGCVAERLRFKIPFAGPPLLQGRHLALVGGATYHHALTLTRIRR